MSDKIEERIKRWTSYESKGKKLSELDYKYGLHDRGLTARVLEKEGLLDRVKKYGKKVVAAGALAFSLLFSPYQAYAGTYFDFMRTAVDKKYDNHNMFHKDSLDELVESCHKIYKHVTVEITDYSYDKGKTKETKSERIFTGVGSAAVIENNGGNVKLLSCHHLIGGPQLRDRYDSENRPLRKHKVKKIRYILEEKETIFPEEYKALTGVERFSQGPELRVVASDKKHDIAIFQTKGKVESIHRYKQVKLWGNSSELSLGDFLYVVGFPRDRGKHVIHGYVSSNGVKCTNEDNHYIYMDMPINAGNSGGPVFALRDGKPELVGVARCSIPNAQGMGGAVGIDYVKKLLRRSKLRRILGEKK
ncbi:S1C family serine protease [Candidatus Woesearchaeota archaeon]|nr:S1C family serine protease [Candidatus Woesearchaeota archaeon]